MDFQFNGDLIFMFSLIWLTGLGFGWKIGTLQKVASSIITGG